MQNRSDLHDLSSWPATRADLISASQAIAIMLGCALSAALALGAVWLVVSWLLTGVTR